MDRAHAVGIRRQRVGPFAAGFTLIELMVALAIAALIATLAVPAYNDYIDRARCARAVADIQQLEVAIERFRTQEGGYPETLEELGRDDLTDPWERPYRYLLIAPFVERGRIRGSIMGQVRKDRNLVPINTDFDLYSLGKDGATKPPLVAKVSHDDIVRAGSGSYFGIAEEY